jgi:K+/H+ antiporter YhaU regulatory subunit KhtT
MYDFIMYKTLLPATLLCIFLISNLTHADELFSRDHQSPSITSNLAGSRGNTTTQRTNQISTDEFARLKTKIDKNEEQTAQILERLSSKVDKTERATAEAIKLLISRIAQLENKVEKLEQSSIRR